MIRLNYSTQRYVLGLLPRKIVQCANCLRLYASETNKNPLQEERFEAVFKFPFIKYLSVFNRLKTYHIVGSSIAIPSSGILEFLNIFPEKSFLSVAYIGFTGAVLFSLASLPFKNVIGVLYISGDNKKIKISSMDFWGKRINRIISADEWIPLFDMTPKIMDGLYLSPELTDKSKYKLFVKFGDVLDSKKISQVLE